jgi:hypothetical protein
MSYPLGHVFAGTHEKAGIDEESVAVSQQSGVLDDGSQ